MGAGRVLIGRDKLCPAEIMLAAAGELMGPHRIVAPSFRAGPGTEKMYVVDILAAGSLSGKGTRCSVESGDPSPRTAR